MGERAFFVFKVAGGDAGTSERPVDLPGRKRKGSPMPKSIKITPKERKPPWANHPMDVAFGQREKRGKRLEKSFGSFPGRSRKRRREGNQRNRFTSGKKEKKKQERRSRRYPSRSGKCFAFLKKKKKVRTTNPQSSPRGGGRKGFHGAESGKKGRFRRRWKKGLLMSVRIEMCGGRKKVILKRPTLQINLRPNVFRRGGAFSQLLKLWKNKKKGAIFPKKESHLSTFSRRE